MYSIVTRALTRRGAPISECSCIRVAFPGTMRGTWEERPLQTSGCDLRSPGSAIVMHLLSLLLLARSTNYIRTAL